MDRRHGFRSAAISAEADSSHQCQPRPLSAPSPSPMRQSLAARRGMAIADDATLTIMRPSGSLQVVEVDSSSATTGDGGMLKLRKDEDSHGFWNRARGIFLNSVLTQPEVDALRQGAERALTSDIRIIKRRDMEDDYTRLAEEKQFSNTMHEQWLKYLTDEIILLRIERENERLAVQQSMTTPRNKGSGSDVVNSSQRCQHELDTPNHHSSSSQLLLLTPQEQQRSQQKVHRHLHPHHHQQHQHQQHHHYNCRNHQQHQKQQQRCDCDKRPGTPTLSELADRLSADMATHDRSGMATSSLPSSPFSSVLSASLWSSPRSGAAVAGAVTGRAAEVLALSSPTADVDAKPAVSGSGTNVDHAPPPPPVVSASSSLSSPTSSLDPSASDARRRSQSPFMRPPRKGLPVGQNPNPQRSPRLDQRSAPPSVLADSNSSSLPPQVTQRKPLSSRALAPPPSSSTLSNPLTDLRENHESLHIPPQKQGSMVQRPVLQQGQHQDQQARGSEQQKRNTGVPEREEAEDKEEEEEEQGNSLGERGLSEPWHGHSVSDSQTGVEAARLCHHLAAARKKERHRRGATIGTTTDLDGMFSEGGTRRTLPLTPASGVQAAMIAAEAAATGGKRMIRVWERMKKMIPQPRQTGAQPGQHQQQQLAQQRQQGGHHGQFQEQEQLQQNAEGLWPQRQVQWKQQQKVQQQQQQQHALQQQCQPSEHDEAARQELLLRLVRGEVEAEERGSAWLDVALGDKENDLLDRTSYYELLQQPSSASREIERDVNRTFPSHCMFKEEKGDGQKKLFNVIKAYAVLDKEVGYCQGMGFITAMLLMNMGEEDAFACLCYLMYRCGLRGIFQPDMQQLQMCMYKLASVLAASNESVHTHFEKLDIKPVMFAADWFLTLFARTMPHYLVFRVFDIIFAEKTNAVVFKLAVVLLQVGKRQLLQCPEMEYCMYFLRAELPSQLRTMRDSDLEELVAKALRIKLEFEDLLRLQTEYELLAGEATAAAREVQVAAVASEAAATQWEQDRSDMETRMQRAVEAAQEGRRLAVALQREVNRLREQAGLQTLRESSTTSLAAARRAPRAGGTPRARCDGGRSSNSSSTTTTTTTTSTCRNSSGGSGGGGPNATSHELCDNFTLAAPAHTHSRGAAAQVNRDRVLSGEGRGEQQKRHHDRDGSHSAPGGFTGEDVEELRVTAGAWQDLVSAADSHSTMQLLLSVTALRKKYFDLGRALEEREQELEDRRAEEDEEAAAHGAGSEPWSAGHREKKQHQTPPPPIRQRPHEHQPRGQDPALVLLDEDATMR